MSSSYVMSGLKMQNGGRLSSTCRGRQKRVSWPAPTMCCSGAR